jgi:MoCo/4Fe-4S cofactor protein with predicted Tat translocation signal
MKDHNKVWISSEDLEGSEQLRQQSQEEFYNLPILNEISSETAQEDSGLSANRRDFLKYLGFSLGAATIAAACETPIRKAIPYVVKPDAIVPGIANYYASSIVRGGEWVPVLVKTREGRPIKIEGNTLSSATRGGTSARAQAAVLDLYDTARLRYPGKISESGIEEMSWDAVDQEVVAGLKSASNIRIITNTEISPSAKAALADFTAAFPSSRVITYDPISSSAMLAANEANFGTRAIPSYRFDKANVIVSFGADFLGTWISPVEFATQFAAGRKVKSADGAKMNRMIAVESMMSITGSNADHRILISPSEQGLAIAFLYNKVAALKGGSAVSVSGTFSNPKAEKALTAVAKDLAAASSSLIVSNSNVTAEQILINNINQLLGNYGSTLDMSNVSYQKQGSDKALLDLMNEMNAGSVDALLVVGDANPVYDIPEGTQFKDAMAKVKLKVSFSGMPNETFIHCNFSCPTHHTLESWSDVQPKKNTYGLIQPTIAPLFKTRQYEMSLLTWADKVSGLNAGADDPYYTYVRKVWRESVFGRQRKFSTFTAFWDSVLHDGVFEIDTDSSGTSSFSSALDRVSGNITAPTSADLQLAVYEKIGAGAGQYANNPWLQELPDPITRIVWDNYLCIPVKWDGRSKFEYLNNLNNDGDITDLSIGETSIQVPVVRQFGLLQNTVAIAMGYGREVGGKAATGVGKNAFSLLKRNGEGNIQYFLSSVSVSGKVGNDKHFASVQHHHTLGVKGLDETTNEIINVDEKAVMTLGTGFQGGLTKRSILRSADMSSLNDSLDHLKHEREHHQKLNSYSLYPGHDEAYKAGHHWGMAIDLSSCIGCGACQVACTAENNVPVVGKKEVSRHHEMTWLRIDRYYYGDVENPQVFYQPMMCQHCDNAPCENVCPVAATPHSSEGLNQMTYNRCVGTRYCANNCPYKVRRFNWYDYTTADLFPSNENDPFQEEVPFYADNLTRMVLNPDVTVRSRGVIEKCSFCVQRIQEGKLKAKVEGRMLIDGDVQSACMTACPTGAIVFGDMNDPESKVSKMLALPTNYYVLEEVNTQSSVGYQIRISNRNQEIDSIEA